MDWSHRVIWHLVQEKRRGSFWHRQGTLSVILLARLWKQAKEEERLQATRGSWANMVTQDGEGPGPGNLKNDAGLLWSSDRSRYGS